MALYSPAVDGFDVIVATGADSVVIRLRGELDLASSDRLAAVLRTLDSSPSTIVLDLSELAFLDASGLRVLIEAKRTLGSRLALLPGPPQIQRLFVLTRTDRTLGFSPDASAGDARAAENMSYMRELWEAYRAGGAQALAARMPGPVDSRTARPAWGATELSAFWAHVVVPVPDPSKAYRVQAVGDSVLVSAAMPDPSERRGVIWSLYLFEGRTFIRALTLTP
jgi:anti-sigma B factor antagonist